MEDSVYTEQMIASIRKVEATRPKRLEEAKRGYRFDKLSLKDSQELLEKFHPDYITEQKRTLRVGPSKGEILNIEVVNIFEGHSRIFKQYDEFSRRIKNPDYVTDVLIIGGGGAATSAALMAYKNGAKVILATKLRTGDANTMMAQGGIQAAVTPVDSPAIHYLDVIGGGHFKNEPKLVEALVNDAPFAIAWLEKLGVMFDRNPDNTMMVLHGGGTSRMRMHSCLDYSGAGIMRVLRDEVKNHPEEIDLLEFSPAVELILNDRGECIGAIVFNMETEEYHVIHAKATVMATGGFGRLHIQDFPTTNHHGATGDGLTIGYRAGIPIRYLGAVQYHPTGAAFPEQIVGLLITEKVRGSGADVVNVDGEKFVFPLEPRDVEAAAIIREATPCENGGKGKGMATSTMHGVWLDSPLIDLLDGEGTIAKKLPAMVRMVNRFGIDMTKDPILVYPTLHYQNGGLVISADGSTILPGLFAGGEISGGVHGTNRLMGNSLLDVVVYGRRSGTTAAMYAQEKFIDWGKPTIQHVFEYEQEIAQFEDIPEDRITPVLLPDYTPEHVKKKQLTTSYSGNLW